jgi:hypothetical protein
MFKIMEIGITLEYIDLYVKCIAKNLLFPVTLKTIPTAIPIK